jgi:hypothetical protein
LSVTIVGPTKLTREEAFDAASFSVSVSGGNNGPVVRRLSTQDPRDSSSPASLGSDVLVDVYRPGPNALSAIADDGVQTSTAVITVEL